LRAPDLGTADLERMQMAVFPPHRVLDHVMKALEVETSRDDEAAPDRRTAPLQGDLELVDVGHGRKIRIRADIRRVYPGREAACISRVVSSRLGRRRAFQHGW
jgi:hypothetical protein